MIVGSGDVVQMTAQMLRIHDMEQVRMRRISRYMQGKHDPPYAPKGASSEYRWIMKKSRRNFLPLIVSVLSQNLHIDGYRRSGQTLIETANADKPEPAWEAFRANRMISRQHGVHRSVIKHGVSYVIVLPGQMAQGEEQRLQDVPVVRPVSARKLTALYLSDVDDEWPQVALEVNEVNDPKSPGNVRLVISVYDENSRFILIGTPSGSGARIPLALAEPGDPFLDGKPPIAEHGLGVCPVIRFLHENDLDGELDVSGEVEPLMLIQDQINFDTFNLMMAEQYAAFRQRYVTGMAPADEDGRQAQPFRPGIDRMFASDDPATRFGEFEATPLQPYLDAREAGIRHMSTISQVPPYHLLGQIANMSAEALAAARDGLDRKISELQAMSTDSWRNVFRLAAKAAGDEEGWRDLFGEVVWRDTSARSFAATVDALTKVAQMLGVPVEELWRRIPGVTADDVNRWMIAKQRADAMATAEAAQRQALAAAGGAFAPAPPGTAPPAVPGGANGQTPQSPGGGGPGGQPASAPKPPPGPPPRQLPGRTTQGRPAPAGGGPT